VTSLRFVENGGKLGVIAAKLVRTSASSRLIVLRSAYSAFDFQD